MKLKYKIILLLLLLASIFMTSCNKIQGLPSVVALEDTIKEIILSKGENYDFLNDKQYISKMNELVYLFVDKNYIKEEHFKIGNLNNDNIPELVVFRERDPKDVGDQGALEVYGFIKDRYNLLSRVEMNYDNTNYDLVIGKIGPNQAGILLNNQAGSQSGITYGFILDEGNLVSVLNGNKINLVSVSTENEIADIDNDGILEFSVVTIDPESVSLNNKESEKIKYWYRWDEKDGAEFVKLEKMKNIDPAISDSNKDIIEEARLLIASERDNFISYLESHKDLISSIDTSILLAEYFNSLTAETKSKEIVINSLFSKYQLGNSKDHLFNEYGLSLERLNDLAYLSRERTLSSEKELKENLINNLNLGYKLGEKDGKYVYYINYQIFLDKFSESILKEYRDYYRVLALNTNNPYIRNGSLMISTNKLAERIILIDNFKMTYPYSQFIPSLEDAYKEYLNVLLFGTINTPVFSKESDLIYQEVLLQFKEILEKHPQSNLADILSAFIQELDENEYRITSSLKENFSSY